MDFLHDLGAVVSMRCQVLRAVRDAWCALVEAANRDDEDGWVCAVERLNREQARLDEWQVVW